MHRIRACWMKLRSASRVLCDCKIAEFYKIAIRVSILYGTACWAIKKQHVYKMSIAEMRMLRYLSKKKKK